MVTNRGASDDPLHDSADYNAVIALRIRAGDEDSEEFVCTRGAKSAKAKAEAVALGGATLPRQARAPVS